MKVHRLFGVSLAGGLALATASAAWAQSETTIIHERKVVAPPAAEPAPPPPPPTVVHKTVMVHNKVVTHTGPAQPRPVKVVHRAPPPRPRARVLSQSASAQVVSASQAAPPPPTDQPAGPAMIDRKTVIHRDDNGDVTRHTVIEKQDSNGDKTVIEHRSDVPSDQPPPSVPPPGF